MIRRARARAFLLAVVAASVAIAPDVRAIDSATEAAAKVALRRAAEKFTTADLADAMVLLAKAAHACGATKCTPKTRAALYRDLGVVQAQAGDSAAAARSFKKATKLKPDLALEPPFDGPDARAAWRDAGGTDQSSEESAPATEPEHPQAEEAPAEEPPHKHHAAPAEPKEEAPETEPSEPAPASPERSEGSGTYARWWIGVLGTVDFLALPEGDDLCVLTPNATPANASGYYCTNPNGSDFPNRVKAAQNNSLIAGHAGHVDGGVHPGDARVALALDYALSASLLVGARLGYVFNTYPGQAAVGDHHAFGSKVHFEARATYVFGDAPLTRAGFAPTVFGALGVAEFDGHVASIVSLNAAPEVVPVNQPVNIWKTSGPWFVAIGGGARYQLSPRSAFNAALRLNAAFGGVGTIVTYGPEIAFQYGF